MDISTLTVVRALHILIAALWLGAGFVLTVFLMPAIRQGGIDSASFMARLMHRRIGLYMACVSVLTVLTGLWLYWHVTNGLDTGVMLSLPVLVLGIGSLAGLLAMILGGAILGRSVEGIAHTIDAASRLPASEARLAHMEQLSRLQRRFAVFSRIVLALMLIAVLCMTLAHVL